MDNHDATSAIDRSVRHPPDLMEDAYQLWAYRTRRNAKEVARLLATPEYGSHRIPLRTLYNWSSSQDWSARAESELRSIAPNLMETDLSEMLLARGESTAYVRRVTSGLEDAPDLSDLLERQHSDSPLSADDFNTLVNARIKSHSEARKARLTACLSVLDRTGIPAQRADTAQRNEPKPPAISRPKLSPEERERLADKYTSISAGIELPSPTNGNGA